MMKYIEIYPDALKCKGVINDIDLKNVLVWWNTIITPESDITFYTRYKNMMVGNILEDTKDFTPEERKLLLTNLMATMFAKKWDDVYKTLKLDYNPLSNWDRTYTRTEENDNVIDRTEDETDTNNDTRTVTRDETDKTVGESINKVSGFNSNTMVDDTGVNVNNSNTINSKDSIKDDGTSTRINIGNTKEKGKLTITEKGDGNIGTTTSQYLIEKELSLRSKHILHEMIIKDIAYTLLGTIFLD